MVYNALWCFVNLIIFHEIFWWRVFMSLQDEMVVMLWVWFYDMSIYEMSIYEHEHEHWNGNGDTTPVMIEMCFHYRRGWPILNENGVTTQVVIKIWSYYPRDDPMYNEMI